MDPRDYTQAFNRVIQANKPTVQLANNTTLFGLRATVKPIARKESERWDPRKHMAEAPPVFIVQFHQVHIIEMWKEGDYVLRGDFTRTTQDRMKRFSPFRPYRDSQYGFIGTEHGSRPYFPGMTIGYDGDLLGEDAWLNEMDAQVYFRQARSYAKRLVQHAVYGKLWDWHLTEEVKKIPISRLFVDAVKNKSMKGYILWLCWNNTDAWRRSELLDLMDALKPDVYRFHFLKPRTQAAEVKKYTLQLTGGAQLSFKHPRERKEQLYYLVSTEFFKVYNLERWS